MTRKLLLYAILAPFLTFWAIETAFEGYSLAYAKERPVIENTTCVDCIITLIGEAAGENFEGMVAVGEVIRNRARKRGMSFESVVHQPNQFSCWNNPERLMEFVNQNHFRIDTAIAAWRRSQFTSYTKGSDHYHATYVDPWWAKHMTFVVQIGNHKFYRS